MKIKKNLKEITIDQIKNQYNFNDIYFLYNNKSFSYKKNNKLINNKIPIKQ